MSKNSFKITIEAPTEQEALQKLQAAVILIEKLKTAEIRKLADIVKNDPVKTALARQALGF
ncbi:MAG TPA: hypothetical protein VNB90_15070 [Cytophagaceae bacterium]|jgi:hypothetical protein|nr:hypothetical protein [Cytophagaceae bacterium]